MWSPEDMIPASLRQFKDFYLDSYAALPSNTHLAESTVKGANYCQIPGCNESLSSALATARSGVVEYINSTSNKRSGNKQQTLGTMKTETAITFFHEQ